jgi:PIN domain nuclease of toxin-antitoxin system
VAALLDTHAAIWYVFVRKRLSHDALKFIRRAIDSGKPVYVSAISIIETVYLVERNRIPYEALQKLQVGLGDPSSSLVVTPIDSEVADAIYRIPRAIVPDMPDRIIAATALRLGLPVVTRDHRIQSAGIKTIW